MPKNLLKKIIISTLIFSFLVIFSPPSLFGQETEIQEAVLYLKTQPADPWQTMALLAAGETNLNFDYLKTVSGNLSTDYEKTILALTSAGKDPRTFGNIDFISQLKTFYQNGQIGSSELLNDDFWGILALVSAGENIFSQIIQDSKNFILNNQNSDGGWSYALSGQSDTNDTAAAIMALLEAGVASDNPAILNAILYLKSAQNEDGGFPYLKGGDSDSGSDSWVISAIYKLNQNPYDWEKEGQNPVNHLKSLQRADGSFKWISSEDQGYPILTAYAVIALSQNYYPINRLHRLRIEGTSNQICDAYIKANTALDIIGNGAEICGYTYFIEETSWGPYLKKINNEEASGMIGWLYFVNYELPEVGAGDFILKGGDEVLWHFGEWGEKPTKLTLFSQQVDLGNSFEVKVEYFEDSLWKPLSGAAVYIDSQNFSTDDNGRANLVIHLPGIYQVFAEKSGYIRSNRVVLSVGEGLSQEVGLRVEILSPSIPEIGFTISKSEIDFGSLYPGSQASDELIIANEGNLAILVESIVGGNQIFSGNITLDNLDWSDFSSTINSGSEKNVSVKLTIPGNWTDFGTKVGNLTFWAIANQ